MRPLLILLAACLPLAVLTAGSFVELGTIKEQLGAIDVGQNTQMPAGADAALAIDLDRELALVRALAEVDLLGGEALAGLETVPDQSSFQPLKDSWPEWCRARQMAFEFLQAERSAAAACAERLDQEPLVERNAAARRLDEIKQSCEDSKRKYEELKRAHQKAPVRGAAAFAALVDRRIAELDRRIQQCQALGEAAALLRNAQAAFQPRQYGQCAALCDKLLADFSPLLAPAVAAKIAILRDRARFWNDAEQVFIRLGDAAPSEQEAGLLDFLGKYGSRFSPTEPQRKIIEQSQRRLGEIQMWLAAEKMIEALANNPPSAFDDRLRIAVEILRRYPADMVRIALCGMARQWIEKLLPEKTTDEPPQLREAETTEHEIVRGFFAEVRAPDGSLVGYKRYPTLEALNHPSFDVGTYRQHNFLSPPGESLPRRAVSEYNQARKRLLEDPGQQTAWVDLAERCESLEAALAEYRKKKGASRDHPQLSFHEEARLARRVLSGTARADVQVLFHAGSP